MNLPNKLTLFRVFLIPVFVVLYLVGWRSQEMRLAAALVFIAASLTDLLDGKIARKYNLITDFGKFMDPLADKLLVVSALICLIVSGQVYAWIVIIIVAREFTISGFRLIASDNGIVIAANYWGKFKTVFQMLMVIVKVLAFEKVYWTILGDILMWIALALTVISLITYLLQNAAVLKEQK